MAEGLANLVEGYVKGQDQKMKKAREVADKAAEDWSRQFKVQQAKTEAAQQEIKNRQEELRLKFEGEAQRRLADRDKVQEEQKKQDELGRNTRAELQANARKYAADIGTEKGRDAIVGRLIPQFMKVYPRLEDATAAAKSIVNQHAADYGAPLPPEASPQGQGGFAPPGANTGGLQFHLPAMQGANPIFQEQQAKVAGLQEKVQQIASSTEKNRAMTHMIKADEETKRELEWSKKLLTDEQRKKVELANKDYHRKTDAEITHLLAESVALKANSETMAKNADTNRRREDREAQTAILERNKDNSKAKSQLLQHKSNAYNDVKKISDQREKNVQALTQADLQLALEQPGTPNWVTIVNAKKNIAAADKDLTIKYLEANAEYLKSSSDVIEYRATQETSPGGALQSNTDYQKALSAARQTAKDAIELYNRELTKRNAELEAIRPHPAAVTPGAPAPGALGARPLPPPGTHVGELAPRRRTEPAPKKKIEKKKGKVVFKSSNGAEWREK